jgi:hypothetical protein
MRSYELPAAGTGEDGQNLFGDRELAALFSIMIPGSYLRVLMMVIGTHTSTTLLRRFLTKLKRYSERLRTFVGYVILISRTIS